MPLIPGSTNAYISRRMLAHMLTRETYCETPEYGSPSAMSTGALRTAYGSGTGMHRQKTREETDQESACAQ